MIRLNVTDMSDLELTEHIKLLTEEREKREFNRKANAWEDFVDELMCYLKEYGSITIYNGAYGSFELDANDIDCSEIGKITIPY